MNTTQPIQFGLINRIGLLARVTLFAGLQLLPFTSHAADIDIYSGLTGAAGIPNVLVVLDNAANFSSNAAAGAGSCTMTNTATGVTAANSLAGSVGGIEQCAFYNVLKGLPVNADGSARVNIGFMVYNANNIKDYQGLNCQSNTGGCLVYPLKPMSGTARQDMLNWITTWQTSSGGAGSFWIKASGEATAGTMQEAWAYYSGNTGLSGRSYAGIQPAGGCEKNFIIFLGNSYSSSGSPGDGSGPAAALTAAYGANPIPTPMPILGSLNTSCGAFTFPSGNNHETGGYYADEWTRFMHSTDIFSGTTGTQNISTYTVGVLGSTCQASYAALLTSMANYGGGKYFATSDDNAVVQALLKILNEVQAVNSVFSAATLPVSVNTQGTYLNQIYMGMFRPDALGNPRWVGNVKQYQFQFDANMNLYLADATGQGALSSGGTGFIAPYAASFWTCISPNPSVPAGAPVPAGTKPPYSALPTCALDPAPGFWVNYPDYVANTVGGAFDMPDGEVVEKGGAGQQLRLANLTDNYATSPSGPRNFYTYCPQDPNNTLGACVADLSNAANAFATSNASLTVGMFGTGLELSVNSIVRVGNTATVTTSGAHGLAVGNTITISGASPSDYDGLVTITSIPAANKFTYTVSEYPPTPATTTTSGGAGGYVANQPGGTTAYTIATLTRAAAGTAANATATVTTVITNPFVTGNSVTIAGATPANYNLTQTITGVNATTFTYPLAINPTPTPVGSYVVSWAGSSVLISSATCNSSSKVVTVNTATTHSFLSGDQITISGDTQTPASKQANGTYANITVLSSTSFTYQAATCPGSPVGASVKAGPAAPVAITALTRNETAVGTATVTATVATAGQFANGDKVNVTLATGTQPANETRYLVSSATISCATNPCGTTFTYTITTGPATQPSGSMTASGATPSQTISSLSRVFPGGTTATVVLAAASPGFLDGSTVAIMTAPGTTLAAHEDAYVGNWTITCTPAVAAGFPCTTFTYGPLALTPTTPATGSIAADNPGLTPDRTSLINWVRGEDNFGDEQSLCPPGTVAGTAPCPSPAVTVRPSVHGDVLHSRPIAVNYGGTTGVVVYYGTNDGVYHAINGNQTASITLSTGNVVPPGGELWGFVAPDFYGKLLRQRTNTPVLALPSTPPGINPPPQPKDYFIDGPTGIYQVRDANGNITQAIVYIGTRRGGRFIYALDVTNPATPIMKWKISNATISPEIGQTWSLPKAAKVMGYPNPLLFFAGGYDDGAEDSEPPTADTMGRGIFALDAITGALVWTAQPRIQGAATDYYWHRTSSYAGEACSGTTTSATCLVDGMTESMSADVTLVDRDADGLVDRLYATDNGGNVWRVDLEPTAGNTPNLWQVTQLAALGCASGPCDLNGAAASAPGTSPGTPRKFFFPVEIIDNVDTNKPPYDAIFIGSGDREHPLYSQQAYGVTNRMYMIKDFNIGKDSISQLNAITEANLDDCTGNTCSTATTGASTATTYDQLTTDPNPAISQQHSGYYFTLGTGEKVVNAPLAVAGLVYFGTNQPTTPSTTSCSTNLGIARGYALDPFGGTYSSAVYDGGGLPPSPVSGIVTIGGKDALFCVGCGGNPDSTGSADSHSSVGAVHLKPKITSKRRRSYWYIEGR